MVKMKMDLNELLLTPRFLQYSGVPDLTAGQFVGQASLSFTDTIGTKPLQIVAGCISGLMLLCGSFGALLGGYIGDGLTKRRVANGSNHRGDINRSNHGVSIKG